MNQTKGGIYRRYMKRPLDFCLALIALIITIPLLLIVSLLVRIKLGSPVIFKQKRPGLNEKIFTLYKFRTMTDERDENGNLLPDQIRTTTFGRLLRMTSMDELPQLINIIKGDMSFIGPRPLLVKHLALYNERQKQRHFVRPGLSGLAQINGRNNQSFGETFEFDIRYVENITFINDLKIVLITILKVIKREDIYKNSEKIPEQYK